MIVKNQLWAILHHAICGLYTDYKAPGFKSQVFYGFMCNHLFLKKLLKYFQDVASVSGEARWDTWVMVVDIVQRFYKIEHSFQTQVWKK